MKVDEKIERLQTGLRLERRMLKVVKCLTVNAGVPEKFHATITQAYMSAIAEAMQDSAAQDPESFLRTNPDVLTGGFLKRLNSADALSSDVARKIASLPEKP